MGPRPKKKISFKARFPHGEVRVAEPALGRKPLTYRIDIDLTKLVPELDSTATDIVTHHRDALLSRKDLAQKTKDFRKLDDAAKLGEFKGLLKGEDVY